MPARRGSGPLTPSGELEALPPPEPDPTLGGEDFFAFGETGLPVSMFLLGVANPARGIDAPNHSSGFDLDEAALPAGVAVFAETVRRWLTMGEAGTIASWDTKGKKEGAR